ncbi:MAG: SusC/RagA family TonB-linked outer membrane protein, partial [Bacteroidota bacterium]
MSKKVFHIFLVQLVALQFLMADNLKSQSLKEIEIGFHLRNATLEEVFQQLESTTQFRFGYERKILKNDVRISISRANVSVEEVLREVSKKASVKFRRIDDQILVLKHDRRRAKEDIVATIEVLRAITGTVTDASGEPLPGASITLQGTSIGTTTDLNGNFKLEVPDNATSIVISYIGYQTQDLPLGEATALVVVLQEDTALLDEIVVVGYGTQKKSDIVNAVAVVDTEKGILSPTADVNEMLRGRIAGLQVDVGGGSLRPGGTSDIIFRGRSSIEGNISAIYVVDGIIRDGGIEDVDPDDIESIEFLKDASAQAIYGSRGANGVVLVTTKRGEAGRISVNYHGYVTSRTIERNFDVYSGQEFAQLRREAVRANTAEDMYPNDEDIFSEAELESIANNQFVDWEDQLVRSGFVNSQALSISGGTEKTKVFASANYFEENGIIPTSGYTRKTLRLNVDQSINDKFSLNFDLNLLNDDTERAANVNVITFSPLGQAFDENGELTQFPSGEELSAVNPLWNRREQGHKEKGNDFVINATPVWQITENLQYQLKTNFTRRTSERGQYQSSRSSPGDDVGGIARIDNRLTES